MALIQIRSNFLNIPHVPTEIRLSPLNRPGQKFKKRDKYANTPNPLRLALGLSPDFVKILRMDEINSILQELGLSEIDDFSSENLKDLAENGDIDYLVKGNWFKIGSSITISIRMIDSHSGESPAMFTKAEKEKN